MVGIDLTVGVVPPVAVAVGRVCKTVLLHDRSRIDRGRIDRSRFFLTLAGTDAVIPVNDPACVLSSTTILIKEFSGEFIFMIIVIVHTFDAECLDCFFIIIKVLGTAGIIAITNGRGGKIGSHGALQLRKVGNMIEIIVPVCGNGKLIKVLRIDISSEISHAKKVLNRVCADGTNAVESRRHHFQLINLGLQRFICQSINDVLFERRDFRVTCFFCRGSGHIREKNKSGIFGNFIRSDDIIVIRHSSGDFTMVDVVFCHAKCIHNIRCGICNKLCHTTVAGGLLGRAIFCIDDPFVSFDRSVGTSRRSIAGIDDRNDFRCDVVFLHLLDNVSFQTFNKFLNITGDHERVGVAPCFTVLSVDLFGDIRHSIEILKEAVYMRHLIIDLIRCIIVIMRGIVCGNNIRITGFPIFRTGITAQQDVLFEIDRNRNSVPCLVRNTTGVGSVRRAEHVADSGRHRILPDRSKVQIVLRGICIIEIIVHIGVRLLIDWRTEHAQDSGLLRFFQRHRCLGIIGILCKDIRQFRISRRSVRKTYDFRKQECLRMSRDGDIVLIDRRCFCRRSEIRLSSRNADSKQAADHSQGHDQRQDPTEHSSCRFLCVHCYPPLKIGFLTGSRISLYTSSFQGTLSRSYRNCCIHS